MNLEQYLYEYMRDGGRNPGLLKKFVKYLEDNIVEVNDYPLVVDDFLDTFHFSGSTKRNYRTSCNNFVRYVYRRLGLFLPGEKPKQEETIIQEEVVVFMENKFNPQSNAQQKLKQSSEKIQKMLSEQDDVKIRPTRELKVPLNSHSVIEDEEYKAFLKKYERLCK